MPLRKATAEKLQLCQLCQQKRQKKDRRKVKSRWTDHKFFLLFLVSGQRKRWWWWWWEKARTLNLHAWFCFLLSVFLQLLCIPLNNIAHFHYIPFLDPSLPYLSEPSIDMCAIINWRMCLFVRVLPSGSSLFFSSFPCSSSSSASFHPLPFDATVKEKGKKCCSSFAPVSANGCIDQDALCVCVTVM